MGLKLAEAFIRIVAQNETRTGLDATKRAITDQIQDLNNIVNAGVLGLSSGLIASKLSDFLGLAAAKEQTEIAFNVILKNVDKTRQLLTDINKFSLKTPYTPSEVRDVTRQLLAFRTAAEDIPDTLKFLGDAAAGSGARLQDVALVFNQIKSVGKLLEQDFRQLAMRGINLKVALAEMLGKTSAEIEEMQSRGEISFDLVVKAFRHMTKEGGMFFNAMEKQSKSLSGRWSTLSGNVVEIATRIGQSLMPAAKAIAAIMIKVTDIFMLFDKILLGMPSTLLAVSGVVAALGLSAIAAANAFIVLRGAAVGTIAQITAALAASGWGDIIIAIGFVIGGLIGAFYLLKAAVVGVHSVFKAILARSPFLTEKWAAITKNLHRAWVSFWGILQAVGRAWTRIFTAILNLASKLLGWGIDFEHSFVGNALKISEALSNFFAEFVETVEAMIITWERAWNDMWLIMLKQALRMSSVFARLFVKSPISEYLKLLKKTKDDLAAERTGRTGPGMLSGKKSSVELIPTGFHAIEDLNRRIQETSLRQEKLDMMIERNTKRTADGIERLVTNSNAAPVLGVAAS